MLYKLNRHQMDMGRAVVKKRTPGCATFHTLPLQRQRPLSPGQNATFGIAVDAHPFSAEKAFDWQALPTV
ncbi:MAG: hypothetical protein K8F26_06375 [Thiobacillus sp.]|nr:hypothetical protein [Thiobacillus sp.]